MSTHNHFFHFLSSFPISHPLLCAVHLSLLRLGLSEPDSSRKKHPEADPSPCPFLHPALPASPTSFPPLSPRPQRPSYFPFLLPRAHQARSCFRVMPSCCLFPGTLSLRILAPFHVPYHLSLAYFLLGMNHYFQLYNLFMFLFIIYLSRDHILEYNLHEGRDFK